MKSRIDSPLPGSATRRIATVTISAPDSSMASRMISFDDYFPLPTTSPERNSLPPTTGWGPSIPLSPPQGSPYPDLVPSPQRPRAVFALRRDLAIHRHRGELALDLEELEEAVDGDARLHHHRLAVHGPRDGPQRPAPPMGRPTFRSCSACSLRSA